MSPPPIERMLALLGEMTTRVEIIGMEEPLDLKERFEKLHFTGIIEIGLTTEMKKLLSFMNLKLI